MKKNTKETFMKTLVSLSWIYVILLSGTYSYVAITEGMRYIMNGCSLDDGYLFVTMLAVIILIINYPVRSAIYKLKRYYRKTVYKHDKKASEKKEAVPIITF